MTLWPDHDIAKLVEASAARDENRTLQAVIKELAGGAAGADVPELISVLAGEEAPFGLGDVEGMVNGGIELELRRGGQAAYWWLLAAE